MRSAVCSGIAWLALTSGCSQYAVTRARVAEENVERQETLANGSEVRARVIASDGRELVLAVEEVPMCRRAVQGTVRQVDVTDRRRRPAAGAVPLLGVLGAAMLVGTVTLFAKADLSTTDCGLEHDLSWTCTEHRTPAFGIGLFGLGAGTVMATPLTVHLLRAKHTHTEARGEWEPLSRWDAPSRPCDSGTPTPVANREVQIKTKYRSTEMVTLALTGADGTIKLPSTSNLVAGVCGPGTVEVSAGTYAEPADSPARPSTTTRPGKPVRMDAKPGGTPSWTELAAAGQIEVAAAQQCCIAVKKAAFTSTCTKACAEAGNSGRCLDALDACFAKADASEDPAFGRPICQDLFAECLVVHGSSLANLTSCTETCSREKARLQCGQG